MRFSILAAAFLCLAPAAAAQPAAPDRESALLADLINVLPNSPALVKSLGDAAEYVLRWKLPGDAEGWRRRPEVARAFRKAIGLERLPERTPLNPRIAARHDLGDYTIENLIFESRPGFPVTANLYRSKADKGKRPGVLAAAADPRIARVAAAGYLHSFVSQMRGMKPPATAAAFRNSWNDAQLRGRLDNGDYEIDFGSVIPSSLETADVPDIAALVAPRKLLFCETRDMRAPDIDTLAARFRRVTAAGADWIRYEPARALDAALLLEWLR